MKHSLFEIGYISGLLERKGYIDNRITGERGLEFTFSNPIQANHIKTILGGIIINRPSKGGGILVYVRSSLAIQWLMTCYPIVSQPTKDRIEHAILCWKTRGVYHKGPTPAPCHPDRPYHAKDLCQMCYKRMKRGTLSKNREPSATQKKTQLTKQEHPWRTTRWKAK